MQTDCVAAGSNSLITLIHDYGPAIPWLLVVLGWGILNNQSNNRESRKEVCSELDDCVESVRKLADDYRECQTNEPSSYEGRLSALNIKCGTSRVASAIDRLSKHGLDMTYSKALLNQYFDYLTGDQFEMKKRIVRSPDDLAIMVAHEHSEKLIDELKRAYINKFTK